MGEQDIHVVFLLSQTLDRHVADSNTKLQVLSATFHERCADATNTPGQVSSFFHRLSAGVGQ